MMDSPQLAVLLDKYHLLFSIGLSALEENLPLELAEKKYNPTVFGGEIEYYVYPQTKKMRDILDILKQDIESLRNG